MAAAKKSGRYQVGARVGKSDHRLTIKQSKALRAELASLLCANRRLKQEVSTMQREAQQLRRELKNERNARIADEMDIEQRWYIKRVWGELRK